MYTLYQSYGVDIGTLFLTGFASSAIFSTFVGSLLDRFGRRNGCLVYCLIEIVTNVMEHSTDFRILLAGRVCGGLSTALMCSAFEGWMVTEHKKRGYPEALLKRTFSLASMGNGLVAVLAGVLAELMCDWRGHIGPFQLAIALTCMAVPLIWCWPENHGNRDVRWQENISQGLSCLTSDRKVAGLGLVSALFEGAMFTFVFMWVPTLQQMLPGGSLPTGLVFSCFMMCVSLGGSLFNVLLPCARVEILACLTCGVAGLAILVPVLTPSFFYVFPAFLVVEVCVGLYFPTVGVLRSAWLPPHVLSTLMNFSRVPLNILVVTGTRLTDNYASSTVFAVCAGWFLLAFVVQVLLCATSSTATSTPSTPVKAAKHNGTAASQTPLRRSTRKASKQATAQLLNGKHKTA